MPQALFIDAKHATTSIVYAESLRHLQILVEGFIEIAPQRVGTRNNTLYVNEEGLIHQFTYGFYFTDDKCYYGNGVLIGPPDSTGNDTNIHPKEAKLAIKNLHFCTFRWTPITTTSELPL